MISKKDPCDPVIPDSDPTPAALAIRLCNFATGSSALLPEHRVGLQHNIVDAHWRSHSGWIDIVGFASRRRADHDSQANLKLSQERCAAVKAYLAPALPQGFRFNVIEGEGDAQSQDDPTGNAGFFRAVLVRLFAQQYRKVYPGHDHSRSRPTHAPLTASNEFIFEPVSINSGCIGFAQMDELLFRLTDVTNGQSRYFLYRGTGGTLSVPPAGKSAGWDSADRPHISTPFAIRNLADFESSGPHEASLGQIGASVSTPWGNVGPSGLTFEFAPKAFFKRGILKHFTFSFGFSKGLGASAGLAGTEGSVTIKSETFVPPPPGM